jgi:hypothetical protein
MASTVHFVRVEFHLVYYNTEQLPYSKFLLLDRGRLGFRIPDRLAEQWIASLPSDTVASSTRTNMIRLLLLLQCCHTTPMTISTASW